MRISRSQHRPNPHLTPNQGQRHDHVDRYVPSTITGRLATTQDTPKQLLTPETILKLDQYPGIQKGSIKPPGAPNWRKAKCTDIHGSGQPTKSAWRQKLQDLSKRYPGKKIPWANLREEPVIYVKGKPYSLRKLKAWNENLETNKGMSGQAVEKQEERLRQEILQRLADGKLKLRGETNSFKLKDETVPLDLKPEDIQTPRQVADELSQCFNIEYKRIPIGDEKAPEPRDLDAIKNWVESFPADAPMVFNCHAGRGRTTTAIVVADMVRRSKNGKPKLSGYRGVHDYIRENHPVSEYKTVLRLIQVMEGGVNSKKEIDDLIRRHSELQDLKESISTEKDKSIDQTRSAKKRARSGEKSRDFLQRYSRLVAFKLFLESGSKISFENWYRNQRELGTRLQTVRQCFSH
jgi:predicted protein tyrosine phosphatase